MFVSFNLHAVCAWATNYLQQYEEDVASDSESSGSFENVPKGGSDKQLFIDEDNNGATDSYTNARESFDSAKDSGRIKTMKTITLEKFDQTKNWNNKTGSGSGLEVKRNFKHEDRITQSQQFKSASVKSEDKSVPVGEVNNNKILDKLNKFEHLKDESDSSARKPKEVTAITREGLKGKLQLFEAEIEEQTATPGRDTSLQRAKREVSLLLG